MPKTTRDFEKMANDAGFHLTPAQLAELQPVYELVRGMCERLRRMPASYAVEPAHVFKPIED